MKEGKAIGYPLLSVWHLERIELKNGVVIEDLELWSSSTINSSLSHLISQFRSSSSSSSSLQKERKWLSVAWFRTGISVLSSAQVLLQFNYKFDSSFFFPFFCSFSSSSMLVLDMIFWYIYRIMCFVLKHICFACSKSVYPLSKYVFHMLCLSRLFVCMCVNLLKKIACL